jgi:hypothetical protein
VPSAQNIGPPFRIHESRPKQHRESKVFSIKLSSFILSLCILNDFRMARFKRVCQPDCLPAQAEDGVANRLFHPTRVLVGSGRQQSRASLDVNLQCLRGFARN